MNKKKVIIFCEYFGNGGIERVVSYIKSNINKDKYNVEILCTISDSQIYDEKVISIVNSKNKNSIYRFIKTIMNIKKFTQDVDIVHVNLHSAIGLFYAFLIKNKVNKIIVHAHNSNFDKDYLKLKSTISYIFKLLFRSNKYTYVACSKQAAEFCFGKNINCEILKNKLDVTRYIYDEEKRKKAREEYKIKDYEIVIGNIGRLSKQKNQKFLIEIFYQLKKLCPNSKLVLIGEGEEEKSIKKLINNKSLEESVIMIDKVKNIEDMYQMFDFYVAPSKYEGYGNTIYEAIFSSLPCFISKDISNNFNNNNLVPIDLKEPAIYWATKIKENIGYNRTKIKSKNNDYYIKEIEKIYK